MDNAEDKLRGLMEGLLIPDLDIWAEQTPQAFYMLGAVIALKAGGAKRKLIQQAERKLESLIIDPNVKPKIVLLN